MLAKVRPINNTNRIGNLANDKIAGEMDKVLAKFA